MKLSEERGRIIKQYVHMSGVKTLSEPKENQLARGDWRMEIECSILEHRPGRLRKRHIRWTGGNEQTVIMHT